MVERLEALGASTEFTEARMREAMPPGRPDRGLRWDPKAKGQGPGKGIWQGVGGTGHAQVGEEWRTRGARSWRNGMRDGYQRA